MPRQGIGVKVMTENRMRFWVSRMRQDDVTPRGRGTYAGVSGIDIVGSGKRWWRHAVGNGGAMLWWGIYMYQSPPERWWGSAGPALARHPYTARARACVRSYTARVRGSFALRVSRVVVASPAALRDESRRPVGRTRRAVASRSVDAPACS